MVVGLGMVGLYYMVRFRVRFRVVGLRMVRVSMVGMVRSIGLYYMVRRKVGRGQVGLVWQGEVISMRHAHSSMGRRATVERSREVQISRMRVYESVRRGQGVSMNLPEEAQVSKANCRKREQQ